MQRKYQHMAKRRIRQSKRQQAWQIVLTSLSLLVVIGTVGALISPAVTMEQETFCALEAHLHTQECYGPALCQPDSTDAHLHTDSCYTQETGLVCTLPEGPGHTHSGECESVQQELICELEESEAHAHGDDCWEANTVYICGSEESEAHTHGDDCFTTAQALICTLEEAETHTHDASCYPEAPLCQLEEHEHTLICYSDPNADLETASTWEQTLPELSGDWATDLVAVALSQLGYQESTHNYTVENEETAGYTRYGAWAGTLYAAWSELFVAFCLDYARIPQDALPRCSGSQLWLEALTAAELFAASDRQPIPGDLIFLDTDGQPGADRMGIVTGISDDGSTVEVIEGDYANSVQRRSYDSADPAILGYGLLPEQPAILADGDTYTVWADPSNGNNQFYKGVSCTTYENIPENGTITLPTAAEVGSPSDYPYTLQQWVDIATKTAYAPGATVTVTENMVLYADWIVPSYDQGKYEPGHTLESLDTSDYITVHMFDYNDLVNLNTAIPNNSRATGADKETWTAIPPEKTGIIPINTYREGFPLDCPDYPSGDNRTGVYRGGAVGTAYIAEDLFQYSNYYFNQDPANPNLGVRYLGTANYLFQYAHFNKDPNQLSSLAGNYYFFDSHNYGAAFNQAEGRFYVYDKASVTTCTGSKGDFTPYNSYATQLDHDGTQGELKDANYWYGMKVDLNFYLPDTPKSDETSQNKDEDGNPMVYYFTGDDDVWVFLDGKLVLDMGGIHEAVSGFINFDNGNVRTIDSSGNPTSTTLAELFGDSFTAGDHTLEMYYMERGGGLANCGIYFNLPARQNLQLNKADRQRPDARMEGAEFTVYQDAACTVPAVDLYSDPSLNENFATSTFTIGSDNRDTLYGFYCLQDYYIKETKAPNGYQPSDRVLKVNFNYGGTVHVDILPENTLPGYDGNIYAFVDDDSTTDDNLGIVTVYNAKTTDTLTLRKLWYTDDGQLDTGKTDPVTVDIYRSTEKGLSLDALTQAELYQTVQISQGSQGVLEAVLEDVDHYDSDKHLYYYYMVERAVPGYTPTYIESGVIAGGTLTVANAPSITVQYEKPTFTLTKKDDAGNLLPGAVFRLYEYSPTAKDYLYVADYTVDESGTITFHEELAYNTAYYLQEISAPAGYLMNPSPLYFGISNPDTALYPTAAPAGFSNWTQASGGTYGAEVINYGNPELILEKVDSVNVNTKLPNATFVLRRWNGTAWENYRSGITTGEDGTVRLTGLSYNQIYQLAESIAPDGYFRLTGNVNFMIPAPEGFGFPEANIPQGMQVQTLTGGSTIRIENEKMPQLTLEKVNQDGTSHLPGAQFQLSQYHNGSWAPITTGTTGEDGTLLLEKLNYDTLYRLEETQAPEGYRIDRQYSYFYIRSDSGSQPTVPQDVDPAALTVFDRDAQAYTLTVKNTKIPDLSVRKEWYGLDGQKVTDASGFDGVSYTLYEKKVYSEDTSDFPTVSYNMGQWNPDGALTGSVPVKVGSTVTLTVTAKDVYGYSTQQIYLQDQTDGNVQFSCEKIEETAVGNDKVTRVYAIELKNITGNVKLGCELESSAGSWDSPVFQLPPPDPLPQGQPKALKTGTLEELNDWTDAYYGELNGTGQETVDGQPYNVSYIYYVEESPAPEGYHPEYTGNGLTAEQILSLPSEDRVITIQNKPGSAVENFQLQKVDKATGEPLAGVSFKLTRFDGADYVEETTLTTDANGMIPVKGLFCDALYRLEEIAPLEGYDPLDGPIWFWIREKADAPLMPENLDESALTCFQYGEPSYTLEVKNEKTPTFRVEKQWQNSDGNPVSNTSNFAPVHFEVYEKTTKAPIVQKYSVTVNFAQWNTGSWDWGRFAQVDVTPGSKLRLQVTTEIIPQYQTASPEFTINGKLFNALSSSTYGEEGTYQINDTVNGADCTITITTTVNGYDKQLVYVIEMPVTEDITVNTKLGSYFSNNIRIEDAVAITPPEDTGSNITTTETKIGEGTITYEDGWMVGCIAELKEDTLETGEDGTQYEVSYTYHIKEVSSTPGYTVSFPENGLSAAELKDQIFTIINQRNDRELTELTVTKVDRDDPDTVLPGAKFTLYQWDNTLSDWTEVNTLTTGADGTLTFPNLSYNTAYKLVETEAPAGYNLNNTPCYFFFAHDNTTTYPVSRPNEELPYSAETSVRIENEKKSASLSVQKKWFDLDGSEFDPTDIDEITVELYYRAEGTDLDVLYKPYTLRKADGWKLDIFDLPVEGTVEINGVPTTVPYVYYVKELPIPFYTTTYDGQNVAANTGASITVTNTQIPAFELPETGGNAALLYALGTLLTATAALAGKKRRSKR